MNKSVLSLYNKLHRDPTIISCATVISINYDYFVETVHLIWDCEVTDLVLFGLWDTSKAGCLGCGLLTPAYTSIAVVIY